jgi:hypothetical protein
VNELYSMKAIERTKKSHYVNVKVSFYILFHFPSSLKNEANLYSCSRMWCLASMFSTIVTEENAQLRRPEPQSLNVKKLAL